MSSGGVARSIVVPGSFSSRSFSLLKVSQKCSQLIHMRSCFCLASGLETRNRFQNRQEKNEKKEFYFSSRTKIFLTRKEKRACPRKTKKFRRRVVRDRSDQSIHIAMVATPDLTELTRARNFSDLQSAIGMPTKCGRGTPKMTNWEANCIINCSRAMRRILLTSVIALFLSAAQAYSVDELLPPFGFRWNDSMAHVDAVLHGAKAKITSREKKENRDVWTVEGLHSSRVKAHAVYF